jgi:methylated-DNA-protein-cysteine methyltransferase related protein
VASKLHLSRGRSGQVLDLERASFVLWWAEGVECTPLQQSAIQNPKSKIPTLSTTYDAIYNVVRQIPYGQVATYGQVAELAGLPRRARLVGYALFRVAPDDDIPWHRVINAQGEISESPQRLGGDDLQRVLLEGEGVKFSQADRVNLAQYRWVAPAEPS